MVVQRKAHTVALVDLQQDPLSPQHTTRVIFYKQDNERINEEKLAKFVKRYLKRTFRRIVNSRSKLFLQDGVWSQNSRHAKRAMDRIGARVFNIPPQSPDCSPIENVFNVVKQQLHQQTLEREIVHEDCKTSSNQVKQTLRNFSVSYIDKTIDTMNKRMAMIIKRRRKRIKFEALISAAFIHLFIHLFHSRLFCLFVFILYMQIILLFLRLA